MTPARILATWLELKFRFATCEGRLLYLEGGAFRQGGEALVGSEVEKLARGYVTIKLVREVTRILASENIYSREELEQEARSQASAAQDVQEEIRSH